MRISIILLIILPCVLLGQRLTTLDTAQVVTALLSPDTRTGLCFDDSAVALSSRLGITYEGVVYKCLIAYDLEESIRARVRSKQLDYTTSLNSCGGEYDHLSLTVPKLGISRDFYFRNGCLTSPFFCLTRGWTTHSSKFFSFCLSDSTLTNPYAMEALDDFVFRIGSLLGLSEADFAILERQKILYYLCRDEDEISRLTGFRTRGIYNLAFDAIVSTYNTHLHELTHLLVNFKMKHAKLFAHPFLQEGLAAALGGRGGLSSDAVIQLGTFLEESQMLHYTSLFRRSEFASYDPSLSYPVAGLYNRFLLQSLGINRYLALYSRHCGNPGDSTLEDISASEVPVQANWDDYLRRYRAGRSIRFEELTPGDRQIWQSNTSALYEHQDRLLFSIQSPLLFGPCDTTHTWRSTKFADLFPGSQYPGNRYAASADTQSVSIYDLWTNTLIANYTASFEVSPVMVPRRQSNYTFSVQRSLFFGSFVDDKCPPLELTAK